jgi:hypothetical protein
MIRGHLTFRVHAVQRMFRRGITPAAVRTVLQHGELVEDYPDDQPYPSQLLLGWVAGRALHVVAADNVPDDETIVITVYEPDPAKWEPDLKRRRRP